MTIMIKKEAEAIARGQVAEEMKKEEKEKEKKRMFENIYDLIKGGEFESEAKKELKKFIYNKNIEWDGDENIISLGKHFRFKLLK